MSQPSLLSRLRPTPWAQLSTPRKIRRVVGWVSQVSVLGMVASALTSESEVGLRADGSTRREHAGERGESSIQGDPKVQAQRDQAGEQKNAVNPADEREAQGGNAADDTDKASRSSS